MVGKVSRLSDEAFNALLERLEVSILKLSELEFTKRIDTEYYRKKFLKIENRIKETNHSILGELASLKIGPFGSAFKTEKYVKDRTYRYIRGKDVKPLVLMEDDNVYMPKADYYRLEKYALQENDVLVSVVGTLGNAAIINKQALPAIFSCKSTAIRVKSINPFYLLAYFNSFYGRELLIRKERGAIQKGLNLDDLKRLEIFIPSFEFQNTIEFIFKKSYQAKENSKNLYTSAETQLLAALGLSDYQPSTENIQVKSLKDSFLSSGRLDAEYYQPKYEETEAKIKNYIGGWDYLGNRIEAIDTGEYSNYYLKKAENLTFFIRNTNIKNGLIEEANTHFVNSSDFKKFVHTGDILTARVGAIGTFGSITKEFDGCVYSDNVLRIRFPDSFSPEIYTMYFNSIPNQELMERIAGGSVQPLITQTTLKQIIIPIFNADFQVKTSNAIQRSFVLKNQSKHLLKIAKEGVEKAIERTEREAITWMEKEIKHLDRLKN